MSTRVVLVALLVVVAGCGGAETTETATTVPGGTTAATPAPTATASPAPTPTQSATPAPTPTSTPTPAPPNNPWHADPVTVAIVDNSSDTRNWEPVVNETLQWWSANAGNYTRFEATFTLVNDSARADVVVVITDEVTTCGYTLDSEFIGCADRYDHAGAAEEQTKVRIEAGYDHETTLELLKHEFGHTLGLIHDDADELALMNATQETTPESLPNVSERPIPWRNSTLTVYVNMSNVATVEEGPYNAEVDRALEYYESGADGHVPANVSFVRVSDEDAADLVITPNAELSRGTASRGRFSAYDLDADAAYEYYAVGYIDIDSDTSRRHVAWHVGYWLAAFLISGGRSEFPPPFDGDDDDRDW